MIYKNLTIARHPCCDLKRSSHVWSALTSNQRKWCTYQLMIWYTGELFKMANTQSPHNAWITMCPFDCRRVIIVYPVASFQSHQIWIVSNLSMFCLHKWNLYHIRDPLLDRKTSPTLGCRKDIPDRSVQRQKEMHVSGRGLCFQDMLCSSWHILLCPDLYWCLSCCWLFVLLVQLLQMWRIY